MLASIAGTQVMLSLVRHGIYVMRFVIVLV